MLEWFNGLKDVLNLDNQKKYILVSHSIFVGCIYYLYNNNVAISERLAASENRCSEMMASQRLKNEEEFSKFREIYQTQIDGILVKKNKEVDSTNTAINKMVKKINMDLIKNKNNIDQIKNEIYN